jgi:hypothetical protein
VPGTQIVQRIRDVVKQYGPIVDFRGYFENETMFTTPGSMNLKSELVNSGVHLIDCPHNKSKDVVDKMIIGQ